MARVGLPDEARAARASTRAVLAIALAGACAVGGCRGLTRAGGARGDTVYIGVATSPTSRTGPSVRAVQLAVERLNAQRATGSPLFAVRMAPKEQPSQVAVAASFRDDPAVVGVVGHEKSGETLEAAPVYADLQHNGRNALVAITPTATNPDLTKTNPWIFRTCPTDDDRGLALAQFLADSVRDRRVAVIYRNDLSGRGFQRLFVPLLEKVGGTAVERDPYLVGLTEYRAYAQRIRQREIPIVVLTGAAADAPAIAAALQAAGARGRLFVADDASYLAQDPGTARELAGVRYLTFYVPNEQGPDEEATFVRSFRQRYGEMPDGRDAFSYEAANVIGAAVRAVGPDRRKVRDWIARVGNGNPPLPGVTGEIRFNANRTAQGKHVWIGEVKP